MRKPVTSLEPGDKYLNLAYDTEVTILGYPTEGKEIWGSPNLRFPARREDTGAEGIVTFGYGAEVELMEGKG